MTELLFDPGPAIKRRRQHSPVDLIFCQDDPVLTGMLAHNAGWVLGMRSKHGAIERWERAKPLLIQRNCRIDFIDNDWQAHDQDRHVAFVAAVRPKYATVHDVMAADQLPRALDDAAVLAEYATNVIVIPKVDVLDAIPERYVLGYSVPTSYGATPLPLEAFRGRRVHLLGGSWRTQRTFLSKLGEDVVSIDCNQHLMVARKGSFIMQDGEVRQMYEDLGVKPRNVWVCALALSLGNIGTEVDSFSLMRAHRSLDEELANGSEVPVGDP